MPCVWVYTCQYVFTFQHLPLTHPAFTPTPVWGFSFLSVTVVSAFSLTGAFLVPLMTTRYMNCARSFLIALSIGTLYSTAVLQLLPEVCHSSIHLPNPFCFKKRQTSTKLKDSVHCCTLLFTKYFAICYTFHFVPSGHFSLLTACVFPLCFSWGSNKHHGRAIIFDSSICITSLIKVFCVYLCLYLLCLHFPWHCWLGLLKPFETLYAIFGYRHKLDFTSRSHRSAILFCLESSAQCSSLFYHRCRKLHITTEESLDKSVFH